MGKDLKGKELGKGYRQHRSGTYEARGTYCGHKIDVYGKDYEECRDKFEAIRQQIKNGTFVESDKITLETYFDTEYLETKKNHKCADSTIVSRKYFFENCVRNYPIAKKRLQSIERRDIKLHCNALVKEKSARRVNDTIGFLNDIFNCALRDGIININPCTLVERLPYESTVSNEKDGHHRALTVDEIAKLQETFDPWYRNLFDCLIYTGCRIGELTSLTWNDIDFEKGELNIDKTLSLDQNENVIVKSPKTKNSIRKVGINSLCLDALKKQRAMIEIFFGTSYTLSFPAKGKTHSDDGLVFPSMGGTFLRNSTVNDAFERACIKADIPKITAHATRHTYTTLMYYGGMKQAVLEKSLGHTNGAMTSLYTHTRDNQVINEMQKLETVFMHKVI